MIPYLLSRMVCYVAGYIYPAYASYKAIKSRNSMRLQAWLMYWTVLGMYTIVEYVADMVLFWFPFYYDMKMLFILWMMLPQTQGSIYVYQMFVEPYLAGHEQEIDKTLQDAQTQAKAMGLEYIKRGIAAVQKLVLDTLAKAAAGGQPPASSESFQAAAAAPGAKAGDPTSAPAPPAAAGAPGYLSWAYNMVSPKLTAVATMASQKVSSQLPSRPLPRPPINLYSPSSESGTEPNLAAGGTPGQPSSSASSSQGYFWRRQPSSAMAVDPSEGDLRQSSGLGITPPVSPDDQKRLDHLSNHLETAAGFISRAYLAPTASSSSSPSGAGGASTGANPMANATAADVRRRTLSLYGVESDHE